jgi:plastocyanin
MKDKKVKGRMGKTTVLLLGAILCLAVVPIGLIAGIAGAEEEPEPLELTVYTGSFYFDPDEIEAEPGAEVKLTFINEDVKDHDFTIDGPYNISHFTPAKSTTYLNFTADHEGEFEVYCNQTGHKESGHVAEFHVAEHDEDKDSDKDDSPGFTGLLASLAISVSLVVMIGLRLRGRNGL